MTVSRINTREEAFWWADILIPLFVGFIFYTVLKSEHVLPYLVGKLFGPGRITVFGRTVLSAGVFRALCLYGRDFLWGYSLMFALGYWFKGELSELRKAFGIGAIFEMIIVIWQFFTAMGGAFDPGHIILGIVGNVTAILAILIHKRAVV